MNTPTRQDPERIWTFIAGTLAELGVPSERISKTALITDDLGLESVAFVELQVALEDELEVEIDPIAVIELNELSAIVRYLCELPCVER